MTDFDPIRLALLSSRLDGVVRSMMNTIFRTGRSGVLNSANDFSCCILTAEHELLMGAESLPIHTMSGPDMIARHVNEQRSAAASRRRILQQLAIPRQLPRCRPLHRRAGLR